MHRAHVEWRHDLEKDEMVITRVDELGCHSVTREPVDTFVRPMLRAGTADNDINTLTGQARNVRYRAGWYDTRAYQNAYKPPQAFPRSEQEMDAIMIRRVNARLRLKQEKHWRHLKVAGIAVAAAWLLPVLCAIFARTWGFALAWIAS